MDARLLTICLLTAIVHLIGALAYAARIAGVRTRRIAMSFALFNALVLISRLSNGFLSPLIAKRVEEAITFDGGGRLVGDFRLLMLSASVGVFVGILAVPTAQRLFATVITRMQQRRSLARVVLRSATPGGLRTLRTSLAFPRVERPRSWRPPASVGWRVLIANCAAQAILVVGVLASLYAGFLNPEYRVTASQLSALINGVATILLFLFIDPQLSVLTDDVIDGQLSEAEFRTGIIWISASRLAGTFLAQLLFVPSAVAIAWTATQI